MFRLALAVVFCSALAAGADEIHGRFFALPHDIDDNESGIWIIDTQTGNVRYCLRTPVASSEGGSKIVCVAHAE